MGFILRVLILLPMDRSCNVFINGSILLWGMWATSFLIGFKCARCGRSYDPRIPHRTCRTCGGPLLAAYDIESIKDKIDRNIFGKRINSMWRYRELLPASIERNIVSLGEGYTPLLKANRLGEVVAIRNLFVKDESRNPTGTFKDRPVSVSLSVLKELGVKAIAMATAGNAGASLAAYGAKAGFEIHIAMPVDTFKPIYVEASIRGVDVRLVNGLISDAAKIIEEGVSKYGWFDISTMRVPYRVEGTKTMGYEVVEQLSWSPPDVIIFPTGGGEGVIGMWKGFKELVELGWIDKIPRIVAVQPEGCKPVVEALRKGLNHVEYYEGCSTIALGLRVPKPFADIELLNSIRESRGTAIAVGDDEIIASMKEIASKEGLFIAPEGAATYAAVKKLVDENLIDRDEVVVLFFTGTGLKYIDLVYRNI